MNKKELHDKALTLPLKPGVYIMMNKTGEVIYVGKAKALRNRVTSYFQSGSGHTQKTVNMVAQVNDFDTIVAGTEFEALVLECSLIKRHQPKYNILLKSDKGGYPFIRIPREPYARLYISKKYKEDDSRYLGPYGGRKVASSVVKTLSEVLKLPTCERKFPRDIGKERPCLQRHLNRCIAPCEGNITKEEYNAVIEQAVLLMEGKHSKLLGELDRQMLAAADNLEFEKAAALRDRRNAVSNLSKRQKVIAGGKADTDVIGFHAGAAKSCVAVLHYLNGELFSRDIVMFPLEEEREVISGFLTQYYANRPEYPKLILLPCEIEDKESVAQLLNTKLRVPKRGDDVQRVRLAVVNAREELERVTTKEERAAKNMLELTRALNLDETVRRIEAFDISNTGDKHRVGAMTVFLDGEPRKRDYRLFTIKDETINDDYHAMQEVLTRRFKRLLDEDKKFSDMPDVLFIDGGATHAKMAVRALDTLGISVPVFGMVKDSRHRTRGLVTPDNMEIGITHSATLFATVGRIQEETHRFAITFHRKKRDTVKPINN
ncbi:MAG: excinuclease ABC subunit UvrC [Oscillospiraceae bacterium]|nr:excinuclease ABC subunit UvrC [Oscillospiraceae bacterium]